MANKLELTWYGKDEPLKIEPRLLIENIALSNTASDPDTTNMLIHGDNLLALKALEQRFGGQVKCIYIDPPYNTGSAFEHYDDNLEHSQWLNLMRPRLQIIHSLLSEDGSMWISIDDDECHYLKVLCDEVFGRKDFITCVSWQKKGSRSNDAKYFSDNHDYILIYAKNKESWKINRLPRGADIPKGYSNPDNDPRGVWTSTIMSAKSGSDSLLYEITTPSGRVVLPPKGRFWSCSQTTFARWCEEGRIWFGPKGDNAPRKKTFLSEVQDGLVPLTVWLRDEVGDNQEAKHEIKALNLSDAPFATPKPERLIQRILTIATNEGDLVLDSFLGSGTTAAVAHKMNRRHIGVEMEKTAYIYCKPRLDMIIAGTDKGGITKSAKWQGGGGYRFFELAPTLINRDPFDEFVINEEYNADMLAAAVALHEGFRYQPDGGLFWKQSVGNESSYLFVTTRHLNSTYLDSIKDTMEDGEYLIIACRSFDSGLDKAYSNITVKKIPQMLLDRCEFGKADYNLNIVHPPVYEDEEVDCDE